MTLLIHLGYLAYDGQKQEIYIPNQEVMDEFENVVEDIIWFRMSEISTKFTVKYRRHLPIYIIVN